MNHRTTDDLNAHLLQQYQGDDRSLSFSLATAANKNGRDLFVVVSYRTYPFDGQTHAEPEEALLLDATTLEEVARIPLKMEESADAEIGLPQDALEGVPWDEVKAAYNTVLEDFWLGKPAFECERERKIFISEGIRQMEPSVVWAMRNANPEYFDWLRAGI